MKVLYKTGVPFGACWEMGAIRWEPQVKNWQILNKKAKQDAVVRLQLKLLSCWRQNKIAVIRYAEICNL